MESFNTALTIGKVALTWNAIFLALGVLTAVVVSQIIVKKRGLYKDLALDACIVAMPCGLIGGRLFSVLSGKISFSSFFAFSDSGLNLPGALMIACVGLFIYLRIKKLSAAEAVDALIPGAFFGLAVGRWSDFFLCEGLGPIAGAGVPKFFPLVTFTAAYFRDAQTVAYAVFFLDFLICLALGIAALLLHKKLGNGKAATLFGILYLFAEFVLEWLRDGSYRQIVFGEVRFNQIVLLGMLLIMIGITLYRSGRRSDGKLSTEPESHHTGDEPEEEPEEAAEETEEDISLSGISTEGSEIAADGGKDISDAGEGDGECA